MKHILQDILKAKSQGKKLLAILLDPDKINWDRLELLFDKVNRSKATHILVGGSSVAENLTDILVSQLKQNTRLPVVLFPGDYGQITAKADALLFLSLVSGRNPEYLITQQIKAAPILQKANIEVIPTSYILIESGNQTAVARVSNTRPIPQNNVELILHTAQAGAYLGHQLTYLEAGSGAKTTVSEEIISAICRGVSTALIVGGGIRTQKQIDQAYRAGADMVVVGTVFEENIDFFE
ncbi:MAG TPA: geranylgeranylglyceryl/heptaprenylglyceryl phosphate synthase [Flavobacterium sp.]|nr:geranylgeranylglyceryl/heptaprenylglyceryl phosphate synthase [Flavobacterium sp.]